MSTHSALKKRRRLLFAVTLGALSFAGCSAEKEQEISAATSGYVPKDTAKKKPGNDTSAAANATDSMSTNSPQEIAKSATPPSDAKGDIPTASPTPEFQLGSVDPAIANRDFMKLKLPASMEDVPSILEYLQKNSRSIRELTAEASKQGIPRDVAIRRGLELGRDKVKAVEQLAKIATDDKDKATAELGKLEALAQMASMGDVISRDDLQEYAAKQVDSPFPEVSEQSAAILLAFSVGDFQRDAKSVESVTTLIEKAIAKKGAGAPTLSSVATAIDAIEAKLPDSQTELVKKVEAAFRNHESKSVAVTSWQMLAKRTKSLDDLLMALNPNVESIDSDVIEQKTKAVVAELPQPWTIAYLQRMVIDVEYSGHMEAAKRLVAVLEPELPKVEDPALREELQANFDKFSKRASLVGNEIDFGGLVNLDGSPFQSEALKGKVIVIDFWATWCGPCIEELPNMKKLLESYQDKGLQIVGVNIDEDRARLDSFLENDKLPWTTLVSGNKEKVGFETEAIERIGINAIPFIAVVNKEGKVAAIHLRGRSLETKVAELLGVPVAESITSASKDVVTDPSADAVEPK